MSNEMTVFRKAKDLIDYTFSMTGNSNRFPKKVRFTFVDRMENSCLDIYKGLLLSNELPITERPRVHAEVISNIKNLLFLIELSYSRKYIDSRQCSIWTGRAVDVLRLTAAWLKKSK